MKRFRFSLERVLDVRELQTDLAQQALEEARLAAHVAAQALEEARRSRSGYAAELEERRRRGMAAWEWAATSSRHESLSRVEQAAAGHLEQALAVVAKRVAEVEEAKVREKALQHLRDAQLEAFRQEDAAADQAVNDEIAQRIGLRVRGVS